MMTQRSSDFAVAGGWNVATGALLTILLAATCDLIPEKLIWNIGDVHLYKNVIDSFKKQIMNMNKTYLFPKLFVPKKEIESYQFEDLSLYNYNNAGSIQFEMNA